MSGSLSVFAFVSVCLVYAFVYLNMFGSTCRGLSLPCVLVFVCLRSRACAWMCAWMQRRRQGGIWGAKLSIGS